MTKIALYTTVEKTDYEEFIKKLTNACEKVGIPYIVDKSWEQVMVLFGYGLAVFNIEKYFRNGEPYLDITIVPISTKATLSSIIMDIQKLLKEMGMDYKNLGFIMQ